MGESGTLACAASPSQQPHIIYAGGQNNGVSSGILKTEDGGRKWVRKSSGLWDTRILGVWVHPEEPEHVFAGTHSGIYESVDGADSWRLRSESKDWGNVMSFREGRIGGRAFILANSANGILTLPMAGGTWHKIDAPGSIASNAHLSLVTPAHSDSSEVLTCIGGWGGGTLHYAQLTSATNATWSGPLTQPNRTYAQWGFFPSSSVVWGKCRTPTSCDADVHPLGVFPTLGGCQAAVNATSREANASVRVAAYTYMHADKALGVFAGHCYVLSTFAFEPHAQAHADSGRAPGVFPGQHMDCANAAVDPNDRNHFLYSRGGAYNLWESTDGGQSAHQIVNFTSAAYFVVIDARGWFYTATQAGAFRSIDGGASWDAFHVLMHPRDGRTIDRIPHDYQRIVPDFRGDQIALPSDQVTGPPPRRAPTFAPDGPTGAGATHRTRSGPSPCPGLRPTP